MSSTPQEGETSGEHTARFPTVGDVTLTGGVESGASTVDEISRGSVAWVTERRRHPVVTTGSPKQPCKSARRTAISDGPV